MSKTKSFYLLGYLLIGFVGMNVFFVAYVQPIGFDDSFNLQIAKSLANNFIYQSTYYPRYIYDYRITTNGIIQYLAAFDIKLFGDRLGLAFTLTLIAVSSLAACLRYSWKAFVASVVLLISYPSFSILMTVFFGEIATLGFLMLGAHFTRRQAESSELSSGNPLNIGGSVICYGLAISTKLIAAVALPFILFGLFYTSRHFERNLFYSAMKKTVSIYILSIIVLILLFYISLLHSQFFLEVPGQNSLNVFVSTPGLLRFIEHHFWQQSVATSDMLGFSAFSVPWLLPLFLASLILLIHSSRGWIPFAIIAVILLAKSGMNERRLFLFIVPGLLFAADYIFIKTNKFIKGNEKIYILIFKNASSILALSIWIGALGMGLYSTSFSLFKPKLSFIKDISVTSLMNKDSFVIRKPGIDVVKVIKEENSPVLTSGWWQFPDLQIFSDISFYDRMDVNVEKYLKGSPLLLLFDPTNKSWPETSTQLCSRVVIETPEHVLCYYDNKFPLNRRAEIK